MAKDRGAQRRLILEVARRHVERFGYKRAVIDDIVRESGIAKGTFYLHFKSKDQLFIELIDQLRSEALHRLYAAIEAETTVAHKLRKLIRLSFDFMAEYPLLARIISDDPELRFVMKLLEAPSSQLRLGEGLRFVRQLLRDGIESGELRPDLDLEIVPFVIGSLKFLHYYMELITAHHVDRDTFIDGLVDLVIRGLERAPAHKEAAGMLKDSL